MAPLLPQAIPAAADSLNAIIARNDSLILALQAKLAALPDTVIRVVVPASPNAEVWRILLGGLLAAGAGFGAQWFRGHLENEHRRKTLRMRIVGCLGAAVHVARLTAQWDVRRPIAPRPLRGLLVDWERYERISDHLHLIKDGHFAEEVDATIALIRMVADMVLEDERQFRETRRETGTMGPQGLTIAPETQAGIENQRRRLLAIIQATGRRAGVMLARANQVWPPEPWHEAIATLNPEDVAPPKEPPPITQPPAGTQD